MSALDELGRPRPVAALEGVAAYSTPRHPAPCDLRLEGNEGARPEMSILAVLNAAGADVLRRYPDAKALEGAIADLHSVSPEQVIVTAGADEAIDRLCRAMLAPGRRMLCTHPTFEMVPRYAALTGAAIDEVPWNDGPFPRPEFLGALRGDTALAAVVSPNNPTGLCASIADVRAITAAAPWTVVLLDHAYVEFAREDLTGMATALPNVVVTRTFSKAWGLAGLRVGYAVGPEEIIRWMRAAGGPYSVSRPSLALAGALLDRATPRVQDYCRAIVANREILRATLDGLGAKVTASEGNFAFARFRDAAWVRDSLASCGIAVRAFGREDLQDSLRITVPGDPDDLQRLVLALRNALEPTSVYLAGMNQTTGMDIAKRLKSRVYVREASRGLNNVEEPAIVLAGALEDLAAARARRLPCCWWGRAGSDLRAIGAARSLSCIEELEALLP